MSPRVEESGGVYVCVYIYICIYWGFKLSTTMYIIMICLSLGILQLISDKRVVTVPMPFADLWQESPCRSCPSPHPSLFLPMKTEGLLQSLAAHRQCCTSHHCAPLSFSNVSKKIGDMDALLGFYHLKAKTSLSPGGSPFSCCYDRYSCLTWNR